MGKTKMNDADAKFCKAFLNCSDEEILAEMGGETPKTEIVSNRFSGESVSVSKIVKKAIDFVYRVEGCFGNEAALKRISSSLTAGNAVQKFDRARMMVLKLDSAAYMTVLD